MLALASSHAAFSADSATKGWLGLTIIGALLAIAHRSPCKGYERMRGNNHTERPSRILTLSPLVTRARSLVKTQIRTRSRPKATH